MQQYGYIYMHKNKENGHVYIGQSTQEPERRFRKGAKSLNSYKNCPAMHAALVKYSWDGFETEIVAWADSQEELNALEEKFINQYKSADGTHGYNSNWISEGRGKQSDSTKEKISKKRKLHIEQYGSVPFGPPRKLHQFLDNGEHKQCSCCKEWKNITEFGQYSRTWDKLNWKCKACHNEYRRKYKYKGLTEEEFKLSYRGRKDYLKKKTGLGSPA